MINSENEKIEVNLTKFLKDIKNIQALPDKPAQTSNELKQLFDKAGEDIKSYINNELIEEIQDGFTKTFRIIEDKGEEIKDYKNDINQLEKSIITKKYRMEKIYNSQLDTGIILDLPLWYKTNTDALDIYLNGEYLYRCKVISGTEIPNPEENPWVIEESGSYYEVDEDGVPIINDDQLIEKKKVKSNKIQLTKDWIIDSSDVLEIVVRGEIKEESKS